MSFTRAILVISSGFIGIRTHPFRALCVHGIFRIRTYLRAGVLMNRLTLVIFVALAATCTVAGCSCSNSTGHTPDHSNDAGNDGGNNDGGPGSICINSGSSCSTTSGGVCCTGVCTNGTCSSTTTFCKTPSTACTLNTECCSNHCLNGSCSSQQCVDVGASCSSNADCCTATCTNGTCATIPGQTCGVIGQACTSGTGCCSTNCQGGVCVRAYSCQANGDICLQNSDCCGNVCSAAGGGAGVCLAISGGGGGGCTQDGNPCSSGTGCCSRVCVDPGSGATVCQPVDGCRLTGDFCLSTNACCGGGVNPNGTVQCRPDAVGSGRCDNGQACNGVGNICGAPHLLDGGVATYPDGGTIRVNAPQDCCDGHQQVCRVDSSGVPRCFGGGSASCPAGYTGEAPCCIQTNQNCQFSDQCCDGAKCLPGDGGFYCTLPNCLGVGTTCTPGTGSNCCNGTSCLRTDSPSGAYACQPPSSTPDAGPTCAANGGACDAGVGCCSQICSSGSCQAPASCQPLNSACTATSDCCSGLSCNIAAGSTTGWCQPGSCAGSGQACSVSSGCCAGLTCLNSSSTACTAADSVCSCYVRLN